MGSQHLLHRVTATLDEIEIVRGVLNRCVDLVGNARGEAPDGLQFLSQRPISLRTLAFRHIPQHRGQDRVAVAIHRLGK